MAEGLISSVVGEEEESEAEAADASVESAAPVAATIAMKVADTDPEVARKAAEFLADQSQLLKVQTQHLEAQHKLHMAHLHHKLYGFRLRLAFQLFIVVVLTGVGFSLLKMIVSAMNSRGTVVDAFQVSPSLAQQGFTGEVAARQVLDHLAEIQTTSLLTNSRPVDSYSSSFGNELRLEVPETGVSFGELSRFLRQTLGQETHVSGEIYDTLEGVSVTVRSEGENAQTFVGPQGELGQLIRKSAESIYEQTQPFQYLAYLTRTGHMDEQRVIKARLLHSENKQDRAWVWVADAAVGGYAHDLSAVVDGAHAALVEIPDLPRALEFIATAEAYRGHDADSLKAADQCVAGLTRSPSSIDKRWLEPAMAHCRFVEAMLAADFSEAIAAASIPAALERQGSFYAGWPVGGLLMTHDLDGVLAFDWDAAATSASPVDEVQTLIASRRLFAEASISLERGDMKAVSIFAEAAANEDHPNTTASHDYMLRNSGPWLAYAKAKFGDIAAGQSLIDQTPLDCVICLRMRGRIAALADKVADSEKWFAEAMKLAPGLPQSYVDRGQARLDRGDVAGAAADAQQATKFSPHDGDAWKLWGDVLAKQGQTKDALAKYDEALKYAPKWSALKAARAAASVSL